jgi:small multidrug resistance family-3 protein
MLSLMRAGLLFLLAGLLELGGCYLVWHWLHHQKSIVFGILGFIVLSLYGVDQSFQSRENSFGRIYAAYGAVFIVLSLFWGWTFERQRPDLRDWIGAAICLTGAFIIMWPRTVPTSP